MFITMWTNAQNVNSFWMQFEKNSFEFWMAIKSVYLQPLAISLIGKMACGTTLVRRNRLSPNENNNTLSLCEIYCRFLAIHTSIECGIVIDLFHMLSANKFQLVFNDCRFVFNACHWSYLIDSHWQHVEKKLWLMELTFARQNLHFCFTHNRLGCSSIK